MEKLQLENLPSASDLPPAPDLAAELKDVCKLLEHGNHRLHYAATMFAELHSEQESKKLNLMKAASVIDVEGEKFKTADFVISFNDLLAGAVDKVLAAAKNTMRLSLYLNAVMDGVAGLKTISTDGIANKKTKADLAAFIEQITVDVAASQETLRDVVCLDIDETLEMQTRLGTLLTAFSQRNMQLMNMTANPPLCRRQIDEALHNINSELKSSRQARQRLETVVKKLNEGENHAKSEKEQ